MTRSHLAEQKKATRRWLCRQKRRSVQGRLLAIFVLVQSDRRVLQFAIGFKSNGGGDAFEVGFQQLWGVDLGVCRFGALHSVNQHEGGIVGVRAVNLELVRVLAS